LSLDEFALPIFNLEDHELQTLKTFAGRGSKLIVTRRALPLIGSLVRVKESPACTLSDEQF
jgi:hypothetical protein